MIFEAEGLFPSEEQLATKVHIADHRHPFDEIRVVMTGALLMNISGNQILLRAGDRIDIPSNTKHSYSSQSDGGCTCIVANRPF